METASLLSARVFRILGQGLQLGVGDVISARVIDVTNDVVLLKAGEWKFPASTRVELSPGDSVTLRVEELSANQTRLRVVSVRPQPQDLGEVPQTPSRDPASSGRLPQADVFRSPLDVKAAHPSRIVDPGTTQEYSVSRAPAEHGMRSATLAVNQTQNAPEVLSSTHVELLKVQSEAPSPESFVRAELLRKGIKIGTEVERLVQSLRVPIAKVIESVLAEEGLFLSYASVPEKAVLPHREINPGTVPRGSRGGEAVQDALQVLAGAAETENISPPAGRPAGRHIDPALTHPDNRLDEISWQESRDQAVPEYPIRLSGLKSLASPLSVVVTLVELTEEQLEPGKSPATAARTVTEQNLVVKESGSVVTSPPDHANSPQSLAERIRSVIQTLLDSPESRLSSGESPLLSLRGQLLKKGQEADTEGAREALRLLADHLGGQQILNSKLHSEAHPIQSLYVQLPVLAEEGLETAELFVYREGDESRETTDGTDKGFRLRLGTANLGDIVVTGALRGSDLSLSFQASERTASLLAANEARLSEQLVGAGLRLFQLSAKSVDLAREPVWLSAPVERYPVDLIG